MSERWTVEEIREWMNDIGIYRIDENNALEIVSQLLVDLAAAEKARDELAEWKRSAMEVEIEWDIQELAKLLGVPLGMSVRKGIYEKVKALLSGGLSP